MILPDEQLLREFMQKNRPKFTRADEDKVYREMILEEADKRELIRKVRPTT